MIIKQKTVGGEKPLLCVPVTERTTSAVVETISRLSKRRVDAIEWRVDHYEKADNPQMVKAILQEIGGLLQDTILIFTYRTEAEGGRGRADIAYYEELLLAAARTGVPDLIDLEFEMTRDLPMLLGSLQGSGAYVIASYHNFENTPSATYMAKKMRGMFSAGADIAKIAVMPHNFGDVLDLLKVSEAVSGSGHNKAVIAIAMGEIGAISRLVGEFSGSCITFVTDGPSSAPGQMSYDKVKRAIEDIHACVAEGKRNK